MDEENNRIVTAKETMSKVKLGAIESLSTIEDWFAKNEARLQEAVDEYTEEVEDKGFWGKLATFGTTAGCLLATSGTGLGGCVALGTAAGAVARGVTDYVKKGDEAIENFNVDPVKTKYYRDKAPKLADALNQQAEALEDVVASEWKTDLLKQMGDSLSAYQLGKGLGDIGAFKAGNEFISGGIQEGKNLWSQLTTTGAVAQQPEFSPMAEILLEDPLANIDYMQGYTVSSVPSPNFVQNSSLAADTLNTQSRLGIKQLPSLNMEGI
tara:strand:+ start:65 stop:865 length:801 start_codon:yes stop_codon:yes gene_type:complete